MMSWERDAEGSQLIYFPKQYMPQRIRSIGRWGRDQSNVRGAGLTHSVKADCVRVTQNMLNIKMITSTYHQTFFDPKAIQSEAMGANK